MFAIDYYSDRPEILQRNLLEVSYELMAVNKSKMLHPIQKRVT